MTAVASEGAATDPGSSPAPPDPASLDRLYREVRGFTETLAEPLSPEDQTVQSMPDVSPTKWHRAHTSWFFETFLLRPNLGDYRLFHPEYPYLFNSYYEAAGPRYARNRRGCVSRPGCAEIAGYRAHVDEGMTRLLEQVDDPAVVALTELGLHHEQQHQELLLMDIKHVLSQSPLDPVYAPAGPVTDAVRVFTGARWIDHDGGIVGVGHAGPGFAFDNEGPAHDVLLQPFSLADRLVTCGEWIRFMEDGGYRTAGLWLSDGWAAVQAGGWEAPLYWERDGDAWSVFTLHGRRPVDPLEPVCHVSYYEADAYAAWCGARLPTEFEWEAAALAWPGGAGATGGSAGPARPPADPGPARRPDRQPTGPAPQPAGRLTDPGRVHPAPQAGAALLGEAWVWTASSYLPYPGFRPADGAVGEYNGKFMVGQQVLRGGSCATPAGHIRPTYRNFFPPAARWPFTGVRLAHDI